MWPLGIQGGPKKFGGHPVYRGPQKVSHYQQSSLDRIKTYACSSTAIYAEGQTKLSSKSENAVDSDRVLKFVCELCNIATTVSYDLFATALKLRH